MKAYPILLLLGSIAAARADIVINEILHDSEPNTECTEFIELYNTGEETVDLSGWAFTDGVDFVFPAETEIAGKGFLIVAQDPPTYPGVANVAGPYVGALSKQGERVTLRDAAGVLVDEVSYGESLPWPDGAAGSGRSMELINPSLDNDLGSSWRASQPPPVLGALTYITEAGNWSYRRGTSEPPVDWNTVGFVEDGDWVLGQTPIGFGNAGQTLATVVSDMRSEHSSIYARHPFTIAPGETPQGLILRHNIDDGFIAFLNGVEIARVRANGAGGFDGTASSNQSPEGEWEEIELSGAGATEGDNVLAIICYNSSIGSSDFAFDFELIRPAIDSPAALPTPGQINSPFASNAPPHIRQVDHSPRMPVSAATALITAKVTDPDGVDSVMLEYQVVLPGAYIPALLAKPHNTLLSNPNGPREPNPAYSDPANWTAATMVDDGTGGDAVPGDGIFSVTLPGQINRTLVRYRIAVTDSQSASVRVPYDDDPSLNFAYFVYDGVPDFVAETRSVTGQVPYTHPKEAMTSVPVYTMLTTQADFDQCVAYNGTTIPSNNFDARSAFNWGATFVYAGEVYDNIAYRLRQRNARYSGSGKRSFRFRFNDGNNIQLHDDNGDPYPTKWRTLNSHRMTGSRGGGNFGLYEAANSVLWNLTGSPAPLTNWFHFRVVKGAEEQPAGTNGQHLGDFYGLLIAIEDYDVNYLETHNLERGNLYKLKTGGNDGLSVQRYQAKDAVDDASDFTTIINQLRNTQSDEWLRDHVNWDAYYRYKVVVDAIRHYDVSNGITTNNGEHLKNRAFWFEPDPGGNPLGKLNLMPWDSDTSWGPNWNGGWDWPKNAMSDRADFNMEYKNVVREFRDLVWQEDQLGPLLDGFEKKLEDFQLADRDRWTGATGSPNPGAQTDGPISSRVADMLRFAFDGGNWNGGNSANRDFLFDASGQIVADDSISRDDGVSGREGRDAYLDALAFDPAIPNTPTITYSGDLGFPVNGLEFTSSEYSDPQGAGTFEKMEWRVAEKTPLGGGVVEIFPAAQDWAYMDDGQAQPADWTSLGFDDAAWAEGPAPLGYGGITNTTIATMVDFGGVTSNRHVTTYFRKKIIVADPALYSDFTFKVHADDAVLVWVNGVEAVRDGFNAGTVVTNSRLADSSGNEGTFDEFTVDPSLFVEGENIIAVELHQRSLGSSDLVFDLALDATQRTIPVGETFNFEWDADWESGELESFNSTIAIPASVTRVGKTYRARVRHQDETGRWSKWSEPVEFIASEPNIDYLLDSLVISEIMYNPSPPTAAELKAGFTDGDEFEYVEVKNVHPSDTIDLGGVRFTKGIDFDFVDGTMLAPGATILTVENQAAFEMRYGAGLAVAGQYSGKLSNGGENLKLSFGAGIPIREFEYDDRAPWPEPADGDGFSLVLVSPETLPDHALGSNWTIGGSPGTEEPAGQSFADWRAAKGIADPDQNADDDDDGLSNYAEYGLGSDPKVASADAAPTAGVIELDGELYATLSFQRSITSAAGTAAEFSSDLAAWDGTGIRISLTSGDAGRVTEVWRSAEPVSSAGRTYGRVSFSE